MKFCRAFTLIEMLIALSILIILVSFTFSSWQNFLIREQDQVIQQQLERAIKWAHHTAIAEGVPVAICRSNDEVRCSEQGSKALLIFIDEEKAGYLHDPEQKIAVISLGKGVLHWRSYPWYRHYLLFLPTGLTQHDNGTFWYCHLKKHSPVWAMVLSKSGRTSVIYPNKHGEIYDTKQRLLGCADDKSSAELG